MEWDMGRNSCRAGVLVAAVLTAFALVPSTAEGVVKKLSLEQLISQSTLAVTGEVVRMRSYRGQLGTVGRVIFTDVTIRVDRLLLGEVRTIENAPVEVTVQVLGGQIGDRFQICPDSPRFAVRERVLVFLGEHNKRLWTVGWFQGKYTLSRTGTTVLGRPTFPIDRETAVTTVHEQIRLHGESSGASRRTPRDGTGPQREVK